MNLVKNTIGLILFTSLLNCSAYCQEPTGVLSFEKLHSDYFDSVELTSSNLVLKFKSCGRRFLISIDDEKPQKSQYGQIISLPTGSTLLLKERGGNITFSAIPDSITSSLLNRNKLVGFVVEEKRDFRSFGGDVVIKRAFMILTINKDSKKKHIQFIEPTIEALKEVVDVKKH